MQEERIGSKERETEKKKKKKKVNKYRSTQYDVSFHHLFHPDPCTYPGVTVWPREKKKKARERERKFIVPRDFQPL